MPELATPESVREQLSSLIAPLHEQLAAVDAATEAKQQELNELRETQRQLRSALRAVDPNYDGPAQGKKKASATAKAHTNGGRPAELRVAKEFMVEFEAFLREHYGPEAELVASELAPQLNRSSSYVSYALQALHAREVLRLDMWKRGRGGRKVYKLVG